MKHIQLFENYRKKLEIRDYSDIYKYSIDDYIDKYSYEGFDDIEEAYDFLENFLKTDFPHGLKNFPKKCLLYRVLHLEDIKDFDSDDIGTHFVSNKSDINQDLLDAISLDDLIEMRDGEYSDNNLYILTVEVDIKDIDFLYTIKTKLLYPSELEITTYEDSKPIIIKIEKFNI